MRMTITELLNKFADETITIQEEMGLWYDWFCKDRSLENKGHRLISRLKTIVKANAKSLKPKFDPNKTYVFFSLPKENVKANVSTLTHFLSHHKNFRGNVKHCHLL